MRRQQRELRRLHLMQVQLDSQLLLLKVLDQRRMLLEHQLQEEQEILRYRLRGQLPAMPEPSPELDQLLGLEQ